MNFIKRPLVFILLIGIIIRFILSAITFHPDIIHFDLAGYVLGKGNFLNFYDYTYGLDKNDPVLKNYPVNLFNYPPAVYFYVGSMNWIFTSLTEKNFHNMFLFDFKNTLGNIQLNFHLILLKIPYLLFDGAIAYFLYNIFLNKKEKILALALWVFNPWVLYSTYMMGQFDIIPTAFVVSALYIIKKNYNFNKKIFIAVVLLGIGASFKIYPLLFLLPVAFLLKKRFNKLLAIILGISVYVITILPFIGSSGFRSTALLANQTLKSLYAQIPISGGESIILFLASVGFFYIVYLYRGKEVENLWQSFFIIMLLFFIFTHYHPQWFLWLTPFLIFELIYSNFKHLILMVLMGVSFLGAVFLFEQSLTIGLFSPLNAALFDGLDLWRLLHINIDLNFARSLFQTLFASVAVYFIYYYFPKKID
ncbi:MAG: hypothetical protein Q7R77_01570 [Candidatus Daviesbacteria bacterium]|nr:hypothetical protein [Candidatus Daviesbacteria bacterium]